MEYLSLGVINDSFGLDGTIKIYSTTNLSSKRYKIGNKVFIYNPQTKEEVEHEVLAFRHSGLFDFVKLDGISTPEEVKTLKGCEIHVIKDRNDLEKGSYFYSDLKGCAIVDDNGKSHGIVSEVEEFPAQLTLRVKREGNKDYFIPFVEAFIKEVDIENKRIFVRIIEGLLWKLQF